MFVQTQRFASVEMIPRTYWESFSLAVLGTGRLVLAGRSRSGRRRDEGSLGRNLLVT
jgi:hypothetical protein